jgi:deoxyribonucleoside regulator
MAPKDDRTILQVASLYYQEGLTQNEIAARLRLSRQMVGRLLKSARDSGMVEIRIHYPATMFVDLEKELVEKFQLKQAVVVPCENPGDDLALKTALGEGAAQLLSRQVKDQSILGISWGTTLAKVVDRLAPTKLAGVRVVQLNGGVARGSKTTNAGALLHRFGQIFNAEIYSLDAPAIVDNAKIKQAICSDSVIARTLDYAAQADICIYSIGALTYMSVLVEAGYLTPENVCDLQKRGVVGDICSRFFNKDGLIVDDELNSRTIGIDINTLRSRRLSIAVAGGAEKIWAIRAALSQHYCNVLVTDQALARELLEPTSAERSKRPASKHRRSRVQ